VAVPLSLAACWLSCPSCGWSMCWVLEGAGFPRTISAPAMDRHVHHSILLPRDSAADPGSPAEATLVFALPTSLLPCTVRARGHGMGDSG